MIDCSLAVNFITEKERMCLYHLESGTCKNCGLAESYENLCWTYCVNSPQKAVAIVQEWSDKNPKETFLSDLLKKYPSTPLRNDGSPTICPYAVGYILTFTEECRKHGYNCLKCWNQPLEK